MLLKQEEEGLWPSDGEGAGALEAVAAADPAGTTGAAAPAAATALAAGATHYNLRSRTVGAGGASGDQQTRSYDQQHAVSAVVFTDTCLGTGKCGSVLMGRCALKGLSTQHLAGSLSTARASLHLSFQVPTFVLLRRRLGPSLTVVAPNPRIAFILALPGSASPSETALLLCSQVLRAAGCDQGVGCVKAGPLPAQAAGGGGDLRYDLRPHVAGCCNVRYAHARMPYSLGFGSSC